MLSCTQNLKKCINLSSKLLKSKNSLPIAGDKRRLKTEQRTESDHKACLYQRLKMKVLQGNNPLLRNRSQ